MIKPRHGKLRLRFLVCLSFVSTIIVLLSYTTLDFRRSYIEELECHFIRAGQTLPDISDYPPKDGVRNIFFLETSCNSFHKGKIFIKARQACAVESAARMNPDMDVYLLYASPTIMKEENSESDRILRLLKTYPNVHILHFDIERFIKDTPVESLWTTGKIKTSKYPLAHNSDILRLLVLWKYGGIYLDLDVIVIKSLEDFPENFVGAQSEDILANGIMGFSRFGKGHEYVSDFMNDIKDNFKGNDWSYNGPRLITRIISNKCPDWEMADLIEYGRCGEFRIFPPSEFYLVPWEKWEWFFKHELTDVIDENAEESSHIIHVWNKLSYDIPISRNDSNVPYLHLATKYCPKVVQELDEFF